MTKPTIDLEAIRARDAAMDDIEGTCALAAMDDRRALLAYVDDLLALLHRTEDEKSALREAAAEGLRLLEYADTSDEHQYGTLDTGLVRMLLDRLRRLLEVK